MKRRFKRASLLLSALLLLGGIAGLTGCSPSPGAVITPAPTESPYEFVFTGSGQGTNGRTFNVTIAGEKDEAKNVAVSVEGQPAMAMTGRWDFVEGKGYKVYLNDAGSTFAYSQYDPETKSFRLRCTVDFGTYGKPTIDFTYEDAAFAEVYDGEGLGKTPPKFTIEGWAGGVVQTFGTLACQEDGTISITDDWSAPRAGRWEYDEADDRYVITFTENPFIEEPFSEMEECVWKRMNCGREGAITLTQADLEKYNYFMGPVYAEYDESVGGYYMEIQLAWYVQGTAEITEYHGIYCE